MFARRVKSGVLIVSNRLVNIIANITGFSRNKFNKPAMGYAIFPCFIVLRDLKHPMTAQWINHETTHLRQFYESFGLSFIFSQLEYLYARTILKYSHREANMFESVEQEAYLNQHNNAYLKKRKFWNTLYYIKHKTKFYTDDDYKVVVP